MTKKRLLFQAEFTIFCPVPGLQFTAVVDKIIDTEILCVYNNFKVRLKPEDKHICLVLLSLKF
jgi:hypothetical protein